MQIELDYPFESKPRYGHGKPVHPELYRILNDGRAHYTRNLKEFATFASDLSSVPVSRPGDSADPFWDNGYFSGLDAFALHGFLSATNPGTYLEIGSGNSTKFACYSIRKRNLQTRIISVDPNPRAEIDAICSQIIRQPLEALNLDIFQRLESDSIVFFDGSHRSFMGSDVTVFYLEVLPRLQPGVLVQMHDILLPHDYHPDWTERYYSEQYLLAALLIGGYKGWKIELPVTFVWQDNELLETAAAAWPHRPRGADLHGVSFWMRRIQS